MSQTISVKLPDSQPMEMGAETAGEMLFYYYPKAAQQLLQKCMVKAQHDHKIELDKKYRVVFIP